VAVVPCKSIERFQPVSLNLEGHQQMEEYSTLTPNLPLSKYIFGLDNIRLLIKSVTWQRDSHGLFDYDGKDTERKQLRGTGSCMCS
jgi:hypothetical protein